MSVSPEAWDLVISALVGGGTVAAIAKWAVSRFLAQQDEMIISLRSIEKRLSVMDVYIAEANALRKIVHELDREVVGIKANLKALYAERTSYANDTN